jgi:16S rRNA (cytosine1402-N4)-methyltransferase
MENEEKQHKRRVRYKGKYPKSYKEKYKELQPEKYADTVARVIQKGSTPAGMHISIMVQEILDVLNISPGEIGLDVTLGYGGHTLEMLQKLNKTGHLYALDIDPIELPKTKKRLEDLGYGPEHITIQNINFSDVDQVVETAVKFDFVLADLGVSSMQIDNPERGFSYKTDSPLDLRMNPSKGITAADRLKKLTQYEIEGMLIENSDEPHAEKISREIMKNMYIGNGIQTTADLRRVISDALQFVPESNREYEIKKSSQRTFQALRIDVNKEYDSLFDFLDKLPEQMASGGRVAILSFHSGEDRLVKKAFKKFYKDGIYSSISKEIIRPSDEECRLNPRAKSTKMRWAIKA